MCYKVTYTDNIRVLRIYTGGGIDQQDEEIT